MSLQGDHVHLVVRLTRRSHFQNFLRVFSGQIAQRFEKEGLVAPATGVVSAGCVSAVSKIRLVTDTPALNAKPVKLWKYRPFTRVARGFKAYITLQNYVQLNEKEARGQIPYRKNRLKGMRPEDWEILWS